MLVLIAWKNVWRNKRRSAIMITAIMIGLWSGVFAVGVASGVYDSMIRTAIDRSLAHVQIHAPGFREERVITSFIQHADSVLNVVRTFKAVTAASDRTLIDGMGSSPTSSQGLTIVGIDPDMEKAVTTISTHLVSGTYFGGSERLPIVVGQKFAERLGLKERAKVVLSFQRPDGTIVYGAFRIVAIFNTESSEFDGTTVFVRRTDLEGLTGIPLIHEIAIRLVSNDSLAAAAQEIRAAFPALDVDSWRDLAPELKIVESGDVFMTIFLGIILLALMFGITNTMLMSVLDRVREFGVLMAVGMKRKHIYLMITIETLFLSVTGAVSGVLLGAATVAWWGHAGINLAWFAEGLSKYGISSHLFPVVHTTMYATLGLMVLLTACIAAVYPALKAIRLNPAVALATNA